MKQLNKQVVKSWQNITREETNHLVLSVSFKYQAKSLQQQTETTNCTYSYVGLSKYAGHVIKTGSNSSKPQTHRIP